MAPFPEYKKIEESLKWHEYEKSVILNNMRDLVAYQDTESRIKWANRATVDAFGLTMEQLVGSICYEIFHRRSQPCPDCPVIKARQTAKPQQREMVASDGRAWIIHGIPICDENREVTGVIEVTSEITDRKRAEKALQESEAKYRNLIENSMEGVGIAKGNRVVLANKALLDIFGYDSLEEFTKVPILDHVVPEYKQMIQERMSKREKGEFLDPQFEYRIIRKDGKARDIAISTTEISIGGEKYVQSTFRDVTQQKAAQEELKKLNKELLKSNKKLKLLNLRDPHTGLYNHRYLEEVIEAEFHRAIRYVHPLSVIMLDVDYFKSINDTYGHKFGDLVLKQLARLLKRVVRRYDTIIRFGGEEFLIISPGTDKAVALVLAQRLLDAIALYNFGNKEHSVKLKLSIGVASYPEDKTFKGMGLIGLVDQVLNTVKECGGNRVCSSQDIKKRKSLSAKKEKLEENPEFKSLKEKIGKLTRQANQSLIEAIFAFAKTIELKDQATGEHVERTVRYASEISRALGLSEEEAERIKEAAVLHDLGKVGISERILLKKGKLTKKEFTEIKKHPQIGVDIIRPIQFLHGLIPLILYHHERWDGKGYPSGLKAEQIPVGARIIAIADVYQALTSDRPYRKAFSKEEAIRIIKEGTGTQFDPQICDIFINIVSRKD